MPKVTVVVPVYNVVKYIEKCARSLFEQTLDSIELLFVNDCTPDKSIAIIERLVEEYRLRFAEKTSRVRIITMPSNGGLATVRWRGIIEATGDFVIHCDGDDWVDTDLYEKMYNEAIASNSDIVMCGAIHEYINRSEIHEVETRSCNSKDIVRDWYKKYVGMFCWNKMVRRQLYTENDLSLWEGLNMWEDNALMTRIFYYGDKLTVVKGSYYHYNRTNLGSITNGYGQNAVRQMIGVAENLTKFFENKPDAEVFRKTTMAFQYFAKINLITDSFYNLKEFHTIFPGAEAITEELDANNAFTSRGRFRFNMVRHHLAWMFVLMFKVKNLMSRK